ncbi:MAG: HNH endonuclease [Richelia sp. RM2_1_2]|nr:HNH endonuclease [Richelia sp. RM2_1_2]
MSHTLILNADGGPLSIVPLSAITWQDAVTMEWLQRADIIETYSDWLVRSPSIEMSVPAIMMLRDYAKMSRTIKYSRYNVFLRDEFKCAYCGYDGTSRLHTLTIDHVTPRHRGGTTHWLNVVTACEPCNLEKAHFNHMAPIKKPYVPDYWDMVERRKKFPIAVPHKSWIEWLGWDPKLVAVKR